jgi:hypothetical protein
MAKSSREQIRKQWGIPDWRDATAYKLVDCDEPWPTNLWRWQFLRRRPDYRKDWLASAPHRGVYKAGDWAKYGLRIPLNPALTNIPVTFVSTFESGEMQPGGVYKQTIPTLHLTIPKDCCAIAFNYRLPLKPQLEWAEYNLRAIQEHLQIRNIERKRPDKYTDYLRALDAEAAGATYEQIWRTIRSNSKARNARQCGAGLVNTAHTLQDRITQCQK